MDKFRLRVAQTCLLLLTAASLVAAMATVGNTTEASVRSVARDGPESLTTTGTPAVTPTTGAVEAGRVGQWETWWPEIPRGLLDPLMENVELRDVYFPTPDEGWAVGSASYSNWHDVGIILHYRDGEWVLDESLAPEDRNHMRLYGIHGTDADHVWAVGKDYQHLIWRDGDVALFLRYDAAAERWERYPVERMLRAARAVVRDVRFLENEEGLVEGWATSELGADGSGFVYHYLEGEGWQKVHEVNGQHLWGLDMVNTKDGWIVGTRPNEIAYYHWLRNGQRGHGSSWGGEIRTVSLADPLFGMSAGLSGNYAEYRGTCHAGEPDCHWYQDVIKGPSGGALQRDVWDIQLMSRYDGWLVGGDDFVGSTIIHYERRTSDIWSRANIRWTLVDVENDPDKTLYGLHMLPGPDGWAVDGWAVGEDGVILHYQGPDTAGGQTPTATPTATATAIVTLTPSATMSPTVKLTPTPSATAAESPTAPTTPGPTRTPTATTPASQLSTLRLPLVRRGP